MLTGIWKNFEELEDTVSLQELEAIVVAQHEKESRLFKVLAAVQGIQTEDEEPSKLDEIKARVEAKLSGRSRDAVELEEFLIDVEVEE